MSPHVLLPNLCNSFEVSGNMNQAIYASEEQIISFEILNKNAVSYSADGCHLIKICI